MVYRFRPPNSGAQKTLFKFFFQLCFNKKYVEVAISDFTMHLIILKWLRIEKCRQQCGKIRTRNNSVFGHFSGSVRRWSIILTSKLVFVNINCTYFCSLLVIKDTVKRILFYKQQNSGPSLQNFLFSGRKVG